MAGALSGATIAGLIAMAAGSAMQYKASTDAAKRAQEATVRGLANQDQLTRKAEKKALDQAQEFNVDDRKTEQQQIEQQLAQEFIAPVDSAQAINSQTATTQGDVSNDYTSAKAASDLNVMKNARNLAGLMAKTTGAGRLRTNEAVRMADTAADLDRLGSFSRGQAGADQIAIQNAGRPDAELQLAGGLLSAAGSAGMGGAFGGATAGGTGMSATASTSANSAAPLAASTSGTLGFNGVGRVGLNIPKSFVW